MLRQLRRNLTEPVSPLRLDGFNPAVPNLLCDLDGTQVEQQIVHWQAAGLAAADPGFCQDPEVGFERFLRPLDYEFHLIER